ncbi:hypothetical protein FHT44_002848 [Mycolicibacterium sp. BK634]|uniref:DUF6308 family protein n=1 Tax=Mycolicibacterium sp. BK634 TaxID=2587099 RepID=UPI001619353D|nr:DUF6308 family protein [Mycolicibacterium sp. BK634]MBB3750387.1 hypothetical protein [Mycolicibacterium sp. BK634]
MADYAESEWHRQWPAVIVDCDTNRARPLLESYYGLRPNGMPRYTGAHFEIVTALNEDPNTLAPADFVAVSLLSVNVSKEAVIRLLADDTAADITRLLRAIPADVAIVDAPSDLLATASPAGQLWEHLRFGRDGVGPTTTSKLLAAKRPQLLPIWDSFVEQATGLGTEDYWRKFQSVLIADDRRIWNWLTELKSEISTVPKVVSPLRILDVVLWMLVDAGEL